MNDLQCENMIKAIEDGPHLRVDYNRWIEAKDTKRGRVLVGGLGCLGVGRMWSATQEKHRTWPGFDEAPERDSTGGFGTDFDDMTERPISPDDMTNHVFVDAPWVSFQIVNGRVQLLMENGDVIVAQEFVADIVRRCMR